MRRIMLGRRRFLAGSAASALAGCGERAEFFELSDVGVGPQKRVVLATNRIAAADGVARGSEIRQTLLTLQTRADRRVGQLAFTGDRAFALLAQEEVTDAGLRQALERSAVAPSSSLPLMLWIHGFNNTPGEAVARQVQIVEDIGHKGPVVSFVWPSAGGASGYLHDRESALHAREVLGAYLLRLRAVWPGPIVTIAHSLGGFLAMEALARLRLTGVRRPVMDALILVQPDISIDVFEQQAADAQPLPKRTALIVVERDPALRLSALVSQQPERLGATQERAIYREMGIDVVDLTDVRDASDPHLVAFTSPTVLARLRAFVAQDQIPRG